MTGPDASNTADKLLTRARDLVLRGAFDQAGDTLRAYDTLLRARASLQDLVGAEGAGLVQPAVDTFAEELGTEAFEALHERWVAWRRQQRGER